MIEKVHQHYKAMAYSLRRIVCSEDESHIQINTGSNPLLDVVSNTLMHFKIKVLDKVAPGRLQILYGKDQYIKSQQQANIRRR